MSEEASSSAKDESHLTGLNANAEDKPEEQELDNEDVDEKTYYKGEIGDVIFSRFRILSELGEGAYSNVWLCQDLKESTFIALKVVRSKSFFNNCAYHEINMLDKIQTVDASDPRCERLVKLSGYFTMPGKMEDTHVCLVFPTIGLDLGSFIHEYYRTGAPMVAVKKIIRQILEGVDYLHSKCGVIHTDLKPENILLCLEDDEVKEITDSLKDAAKFEEEAGSSKMAQETVNEKKSSTGFMFRYAQDVNNAKKKIFDLIINKGLKNLFKIKISDFGNSCTVEEHLSPIIQTRQYRSPEIIMGANYGTSVDIWSIGCIAYELSTGKILFNTPSMASCFSKDRIHIGMMMKLLGNIPKEVRDRGFLSSLFFSASGKLKMVDMPTQKTLFELFVKVHNYENHDAFNITDFLLKMLQYDPRRRHDAARCLTHFWLRE